MKVLVAHPGTQYSFQLVKQLERHGLLYQFWTGIAIAENSWIGKLIKLLPGKLYKKISNRIIDKVPSGKIKTQVKLELKTLRRFGTDETEKIIYERNKLFQEFIPDKALLESDIIIGFDTSSWILIERCKKLGKKFILDVSIAHPLSKKKVYDQIATVYPDWSFALKHKPDELISIEQQEMSKADHIVVASIFSRDTLTEHNIDKNKITVNPYGVDSNLFHPINKLNTSQKKIRFVFVGLVDARKGVPLLLEAWKTLEDYDVELTLIGPITDDIKKLVTQNFPTVIIRGKLSFAEVIKILPMFDIMVFPSYFEGFGLVILEGMACGLPVITTKATCGPDVIANTEDGIVLDNISLNELSASMIFFAEKKIDLSKMSSLARKKADLFSWNAYGERWKKILKRTEVV